MIQSKNERVKRYLQDVHSISEEFYEVLLQVRQIIFETCPDLTESIKYGGIVFFKDNELIGGIFAYKEHLSIELSNGAQLTDPDSVLEGKGKFRRHIKLKNVEDINNKKVAKYVSEIIAISEA